MRQLKLWTSLVPIFTTFLVSEIAVMIIYSSERESVLNFFLWSIAQAIGGIAFGYLSDIYSRKLIVSLTQFFGCLCFLLFYVLGFNSLLVTALGFFFNPAPIIRATLIDNFSKLSKVKLVALTFLAQWGIWSIYFKVAAIQKQTMILIIILLLMLNTIICLVFLFDLRQLHHDNNEPIKLKNMILKGHKQKFLFTCLALSFGQVVYYLSDTTIEGIRDSNTFFSMVGFSSIIGASTALFYRKTPHVSVLTICYGISCFISLMPAICHYFIGYSVLNLYFLMLLFTNISSFYLPFVYDIVLNSVKAKYRGTACGIIDFAISCATILGVSLIIILPPTISIVISLFPLFYGIATAFQKMTEHKTS